MLPETHSEPLKTHQKWQFRTNPKLKIREKSKKTYSNLLKTIVTQQKTHKVKNQPELSKPQLVPEKVVIVMNAEKWRPYLAEYPQSPNFET